MSEYPILGLLFNISLEVLGVYLILQESRGFRLWAIKFTPLFILGLIALVINAYLILVRLTRVFPKALSPQTAILTTALIIILCIVLGWLINRVAKRSWR